MARVITGVSSIPAALAAGMILGQRHSVVAAIRHASCLLRARRDVYHSGYQEGYSEGYSEGRRVARPVVLPGSGIAGVPVAGQHEPQLRRA